MNVVRFERGPEYSLREALERSLDTLDAAELLRLAAIRMRASATELDRIADNLDPQPETPTTRTVGA